MSARTFGGDREEWSVACPDGEVWPETTATRVDAEAWLGNTDCGCGEIQHLVVTRVVPEWVAA